MNVNLLICKLSYLTDLFPLGLQSTVIAGRHMLDKANEDLNAEYADGYDEPNSTSNSEIELMQLGLTRDVYLDTVVIEVLL